MDNRQRWISSFPIAVLAALSLVGMTAAQASAPPPQDGSREGIAGHPGCERLDVHACLDLALAAMGGRDKLAGIHNVQLDVIGHTALTEQSYRQAPFISSYERDQLTLDFDKGRLLQHARAVWPESDPHQADIEQTLVATAQAGVYRGKSGDSPCGLSDLDDTRTTLALGPERLLLTAAAAPDLHYARGEWLRSTPHSVLEFSWNGQPVRVLLNVFNHLPDAFERTATFQDFWFAWGDVEQRVYYDNWKLLGGMVLPTNRIEQRNGVLWQSMQILDASFNTALDDKTFAMDPAVAAKSAQSKGWNREFSDKHRVELAPGIELYRGSWNATLIKQDDGVLVLEAPISPRYAQGVFARARSEYPGVPIKGVLSTSDSWPHIAGVREAVAEGLPVYALDLNQPLLDKLVSAPHRLNPDRLQTTPKAAHWNIVAGRLEIGRGANRIVLYPLRGASTERQYMVYFPQQRLLYASDTLALNPDHSLYDPELMHEVVQAVEREHLQVDTVFAMHEGPTPWSDVSKLVKAALQ
ncbi:MBL fold metallo-hydrolase [Rhodanobacter koreensis]